MATLKYPRLIVEFRPTGDVAWFEGFGSGNQTITNGRVESAMYKAVASLQKLRVEAENALRTQQRKLESLKSDDKGVSDAVE